MPASSLARATVSIISEAFGGASVTHVVIWCVLVAEHTQEQTAQFHFFILFNSEHAQRSVAGFFVWERCLHPDVPVSMQHN